MNKIPGQGEFNFDPEGESQTPSRADEAKKQAAETAKLARIARNARGPAEPKGPSKARKDQTSENIGRAQDEINADGLEAARQALEESRDAEEE